MFNFSYAILHSLLGSGDFTKGANLNEKQINYLEEKIKDRELSVEEKKNILETVSVISSCINCIAASSSLQSKPSLNTIRFYGIITLYYEDNWNWIMIKMW